MFKLNFTKIVGTGNDFILLDLRKQNKKLKLSAIAKQACNRKLGIGADGLLVLTKTPKATVKMQIFNADGSEAEMCGNGARCVAYFVGKDNPGKKITIKTKAGIIASIVKNDTVKINLTEPRDIKLDINLKIGKYPLRVNFVNTGVPHIIVLCEKVEGIDVSHLGRLLRFHKKFAPRGTNVNFIEPVKLNEIKVRTYERGVEEETLACGTGSVASSIIYALKLRASNLLKSNNAIINVDTASGEVLRVSFDILKNKIKNVWLEGNVKIVGKGEFYV